MQKEMGKQQVFRALLLSNSVISNLMSVRYRKESQQRAENLPNNCFLKLLILGEESLGTAWFFMQKSVLWVFDPCLWYQTIALIHLLCFSRFLSGLYVRDFQVLCKAPLALPLT